MASTKKSIPGGKIRNQPVPGLAEVQEERRRKLAQFAFSGTLGTLWKVREDVWKKELAMKEYESTRVWHPGLSLCQAVPSGRFDRIPMLHGSSGSHGPVVVRGITADKGADYPSSFGRIAPVPLSYEFWLEDDPAADDDVLVGWDFDRRRIVRNRHKPQVDDQERKALLQWMRKRGLLR